MSGQDDVLDAPEHPYTQGLIGSIPNHNAAGRALAQIPGMMPSLIDVGPGCRFRERCRRATRRCGDDPAPRIFGGGRVVSCHHPGGVR